MAQQRSHGYEFDVFISYSSRDRDWVQKFYEDLVNDINRFADRDVAVFFDRARLQPGFVWDDHLIDAARRSAVLVPVLSRRFFESDYCQKELGAFVEAHGLSSGAKHRSRILPVNLLTTAPPGHFLSDIQSTTFFRINQQGAPLEHAPGTPMYVEELRNVSYAVAQMLGALDPGQVRPAVYVAADFGPESRKLRASLNHYYDILPAEPGELLGFTTEQLERSIANDFEQCFVSIHRLTDAPVAKPLVERQLAYAQAGTRPRLVWSADRPDHLTAQGFEWFTSQTAIEERVRRLFEKPAARPSGGDPMVYFLCPDRDNKNTAQPLIDALERRGVLLMSSPLEGPADRAIQTHMTALDELDGCLIYYGDVERAWFDAVFLRIRKKIRQRGLPSAIFLAPPQTAHKQHDLSALGVPIVAEPDAAARTFLGANA